MAGAIHGIRSLRRGQRGSALVLSVLILFAMLGLGMLAMRSTTQNLAGAGNVRLSKQSRFVAELGLYHAVTLLAQQGEPIMTQRSAQPDSRLEVRSNGQVAIIPRFAATTVLETGLPPMMAANLPATLGELGGGMVASYRVTVDGFTPTMPPAGQGLAEGRESGEVFCLMQFTARGFVANQALPDESTFNENQRRAATDLYAEHTLRASVVLGPYMSDCIKL